MELTDAMIDAARKAVPVRDGITEHHDCVRIAYQWLDAQTPTRTPLRHIYPLKHLIEQWGGRYVSEYDVRVAAYLHPNVRGDYPAYTISSRLTEPSIRRLEGIGQAMTQDQRSRHRPDAYARQEDAHD